MIRLTARRIALCTFLAVVSIASASHAENWHFRVGAQSANQARQALAFLPNEVWVHAGDSITWEMDTNEPHTVTFLKPSQVRPPFPVGCPGFSPSEVSFDGSMCVTTPLLQNGQTFTVTFPVPGNYKLVCLIHPDMTGVVHVLDNATPLPHDQAFYDREAVRERNDLLSAVLPPHAHGSGTHRVTSGTGQVLATGGGHQSVSVVRFLGQEVVIHAGETVEWTNDDPGTPHTITFGAEPANDMPPSANVTVDADGARHAIITSPQESVHSGFIVSAPQERTGLPQAPIGVTRFRVTFTAPGTYPYICVLHDNLGMKGTVVVLP